jgi:signal transduction histidine kinase
MSPRSIEPRGIFGTRFLVIGFGSTLLLSVLTLGIAAIEFSEVEEAALDTADDSYSIHYLANIGEDLARLRTHLAFGISQSPEEFTRQAQRIAGFELRLQDAISAVPDTLDRDSRVRWDLLRPQIERQLQVYADAAYAIRMGQASRASELLTREASVTATVHDALDDLEEAHRESVVMKLRAAHQKAASMVIVELVLAGVFLVGMVGIFGGMLSMLRRQRRRLADYTTRLEMANADLDAFAGRVAHDLRSALGPIVMAPSLLRGSPADLDLVLKTADRTERSSRRAIAIVDALLAFSRGSRGVEADEYGTVRSAMKDVLDELAPLAEQLDVSIEVEALPDVHVRCSPGLLHIVLVNLCGNAVKYLEGRPERRVCISAYCEDAWFRLEVEDTGPGIPKDAQEKIFEPFYRVAGTRVPGIGIGLATVRRILDACGGRVAVESDVARGGARFQVWLPLAPSPPAPPPSHEPDEPRASGRPRAA